MGSCILRFCIIHILIAVWHNGGIKMADKLKIKVWHFNFTHDWWLVGLDKIFIRNSCSESYWIFDYKQDVFQIIQLIKNLYIHWKHILHHQVPLSPIIGTTLWNILTNQVMNLYFGFIIIFYIRVIYFGSFHWCRSRYYTLSINNSNARYGPF